MFAIIELKSESAPDKLKKVRKQARSYAHSDEFIGFSYYAYRIGHLNSFVVYDDKDKKVGNMPYDYYSPKGFSYK